MIVDKDFINNNQLSISRVRPSVPDKTPEKRTAYRVIPIGPNVN